MVKQKMFYIKDICKKITSRGEEYTELQMLASLDFFTAFLFAREDYYGMALLAFCSCLVVIEW